MIVMLKFSISGFINTYNRYNSFLLFTLCFEKFNIKNPGTVIYGNFDITVTSLSLQY